MAQTSLHLQALLEDGLGRNQRMKTAVRPLNGRALWASAINSINGSDFLAIIPVISLRVGCAWFAFPALRIPYF
jgi:hypothetical protein